MNKQRREIINKLIAEVENLQEQINELQSDEQDSFDNMSEAYQTGAGGKRMEQAANDLQAAADALDDVRDYLTEAQG